jgi:flagellar basal body-associated protein FliL
MSNQQLPGAGNALTFGIISVVAALLLGPIGVIFSYFGLSNSKKAELAYEADPDEYETGLDNVRTGEILSYLGLGLSVLMLFLGFTYFEYLISLF